MFINYSADKDVNEGDLCLNSFQRKNGNYECGQTVTANIFHPTSSEALASVTINTDLVKKTKESKKTFDCEKLTEVCLC